MVNLLHSVNSYAPIVTNRFSFITSRGGVERTSEESSSYQGGAESDSEPTTSGSDSVSNQTSITDSSQNSSVSLTNFISLESVILILLILAGIILVVVLWRIYKMTAPQGKMTKDQAKQALEDIISTFKEPNNKAKLIAVRRIRSCKKALEEI
jgi:hypothetical protein